MASIVLLVAGALFYLQFGLQALVQFFPQGVLALVGAMALGWGAFRMLRRHPASPIVFLGTVPLLALHAVMTLIERDELPFLVGSSLVPVIAAAAWLISRDSQASPGST